MSYRDPTMGTDETRTVEFECEYGHEFEAEDIDYEYNGSGDYEFMAECPTCGNLVARSVYIDLEDEAREFAREAREEAWRDER